MKDSASQGQPVIEAKGVNLVFETADGPVQALKDVNLTINQGDFVSFIGPSGCGKTTFLRAIAALERPTSFPNRSPRSPSGASGSARPPWTWSSTATRTTWESASCAETATWRFSW